MGGISIIRTLDAFYLHHRMCGELDAGYQVVRETGGIAWKLPAVRRTG